MPVYSYSAINAKGAEVSGTLEAGDERTALSKVKELGLHPMSVRAMSGGGRTDSAAQAAPAKATRKPIGKPTSQPVERPRTAPAEAAEGVRRRGRRVRPSDLTLFTRQLSNLVRGGLPMMRTLDALIENTENARLYEVLADVRHQVSGGASLHEALAAHPREFNSLYLSLVEAGEQSGQLAEVLHRLAGFMEQDLERRAQIRAALTYPALLVIVGTIIIFVLVTFLIPRFKVLFDEFERSLPILTQIVLAVSAVFGNYWWAMLLGGGLGYFLFRQWVGTTSGRLAWDRSKLRWPLFGKLYRRAASARLARTLATLLHGGVNILDALAILEGVVDNAHLAAALRDIRADVREGEPLGSSTRKTGEFPGLLSQMMGVGEETGDVETALNTVADTYDVEVTNSLKGLVSLVEPLIILVMGSIVAVVVFAMLMPIFQLNEGIS